MNSPVLTATMLNVENSKTFPGSHPGQQGENRTIKRQTNQQKTVYATTYPISL
ncbi:hypothetical protein [Salmonella enterica]|uniref:hypothetical protein n=1 Tax=Salmonella enterica TaxID=28901 RepID=UPI0020167376|nr:hypothetical protein [Salmonella enterica]